MSDLRGETPDFKFQIWLEPLEPAAWTGTLYVRAPEHIRTSVRERYLPCSGAPPGRVSAPTR